MIIIISALSQLGKDDGDYYFPISQDETPDEKKEAIKKGEKAQTKKMREKERRDNATILLPHVCFKVAHYIHGRESPMLSLSYTSGNFSL